MTEQAIIKQIRNTWNVHNEITLYLIGKIPSAGFKAIPAGSKGRTVVEQFVHMNRVRTGWLHYHITGKRPKLPGAKNANPSRPKLKTDFAESGIAVGDFLVNSLEGNAAPRAFKKEAIRWMGYLIAHESHHRGQIMLALKQNGMRLPDTISIQGLWGKWMWGK